ncbi:MAG: EamA family transporter [Bacteroidales bacterium]|jgi:drug/metabolite transporter (DMT)-like permease|nr:EamA family transporter [Bacteroidales bacterium]
MSLKTKGIIAGIIAAVCYGTNPLGVLYLYQEGLNTVSTVFYRYLTAIVMLAVIMIFKGDDFKITKRELLATSFLGVFFGLSSLMLYESFNYMDAGVASTVLFSYPVMVAVIMATFFHERISLTTILSLLLALGGIIMLSKGGGNSNVSMTGIILVICSSLTYAVYIVSVNRADVKMNPIKFTFFIAVFALLMFVGYSFFGQNNSIQILTSGKSWFWAAFLGFFPTVISLIFMNVSIKLVGSTPAAIIGALEPLTAVIIGCCVFSEAFSSKLFLGIVLILSSVILIAGGKKKVIGQSKCQ